MTAIIEPTFEQSSLGYVPNEWEIVQPSGVWISPFISLGVEIENFGTVAVVEEIPQSFLEALSDFEAGRFVDMEKAHNSDFPNASRE